MDFVAFLQATQDGNRVLDARFLDKDGLEPAFQSAVLFNIFPILIKGRCPNAAEFTAGQHRFQDIASIHGPFGSTGSDDGMELINEHDDLAGRIGNNLEDFLQALFKFAAVFGPGNKRGKVQGIEGLVL